MNTIEDLLAFAITAYDKGYGKLPISFYYDHHNDFDISPKHLKIDVEEHLSYSGTEPESVRLGLIKKR